MPPDTSTPDVRLRREKFIAAEMRDNALRVAVANPYNEETRLMAYVVLLLDDIRTFLTSDEED